MADRDDAAVVYRYLRDRGESTLAVLAEACFPTSGASGPPSTLRYLRRKSVRRTLESLEWLRSQSGVGITCLSHPGLPSGFVLGLVAQDPAHAIGVVVRERVRAFVLEDDMTYEMSDVSSDPITEMGDLMGVWHAQD